MKIRSPFIAGLATILLTACGDDGGGTGPDPVEPAVVAALELSTDAATLEVDETLQLSAAAMDAEGAAIADADITWTSID
ncbi:MAG TPA: hypothetical protein VFI91_14195, partial [Longimicrobiaceae bacterium]|nr:hypothetical protein [Longimicrobiaceae bacterium]